MIIYGLRSRDGGQAATRTAFLTPLCELAINEALNEETPQPRILLYHRPANCLPTSQRDTIAMRYSGMGSNAMINQESGDQMLIDMPKDHASLKKTIDSAFFTCLFSSCAFTLGVWVLVLLTLIFVVKVL